MFRKLGFRELSTLKKSIAPFNMEESVLVPNPRSLMLKMQDFCEAGCQNTQVVTDFDFTLTKYYNNGAKGIATHQVLYRSIDSNTAEYMNQLRAHYQKFETSSEIPEYQRKQLLKEWYSKVNQAVLSSNLTKDKLYRTVWDSPIFLRSGIQQAVQTCEESQIPMTVVSAGIGNVIETLLGQFSKAPQIVSNFIQWTPSGQPSCFSEPTIHPLDKSKVFKNKPIRSHVLVMGDMPSDAKQVEKAEYTNSIKVGFLNDPKVFCVEEFKENFDIIVLKDGNLAVLNLILELISGKERYPEDYPTLSQLVPVRS
mgnify:CR=1 FL=1